MISRAVSGRAVVAARLRAAGCVFAEDEADELIDQVPADRLADAVDRRARGELLEHVVGSAVFHGLRVAIAAPVFVPRRRAEPLAAAALTATRAAVGRAVRRGAPTPVAVDLGCGSGALAAVLAAGSGARVLAGDVDPAAVACARVNGERFGFEVVQGSWWTALPPTLAGSVEVAVGYLPHVPDADLAGIDADTRRAEQPGAVRGGPDGLDPLREVVAGAGAWLAPTGVLLTLVSGRQAAAAAGVGRDAGLAARTTPADDDVVLTVSRPPGRDRAPRPRAG